jgi:uridine kinase
MDASVATGAAGKLQMSQSISHGLVAMMAIRVLLDHDVPEDHIHLVTLLAAPNGVNAVAYAFPKVNIVASAIDERVDENYHIHPGFGLVAEDMVPFSY